jgi:hypothetical protein
LYSFLSLFWATRNLNIDLQKKSIILKDKRPTAGVTRWWAGRDEADLTGLV